MLITLDWSWSAAMDLPGCCESSTEGEALVFPCGLRFTAGAMSPYSLEACLVQAVHQRHHDLGHSCDSWQVQVSVDLDVGALSIIQKASCCHVGAGGA